MDKKAYVLITDVHLRKAFDVVNILQTCYADQYTCILASDIDTGFTLPFVYGQKVERLRKSDFVAFTTDLQLLENKYEGLVYLPIEEDTTLLLYTYITAQPNTNIRYLLPPQEQFDLARDKKALESYCLAHGFPVPRPVSFRELDQFAENFFPLIVKPKHGSGSVGILHIDRPEDLDQIKELPNPDTYLIQEKIGDTNQVFGAFFLMDQGRVLGYYGHKRRRTYPIKGGVTVYSESESRSALEQLGAQILGALNWSGVAMLEFMQAGSDPNLTESYRLIEINPRFWGSIMLSEFTGSNFLNNYIRLCLGTPHVPAKPVNPKYIRWFFPFDLLNYFSGSKISDFWKFDTLNTCYINYSYSKKLRAFRFLLYSVLNPQKIRKLFSKLYS